MQSPVYEKTIEDLGERMSLLGIDRFECPFSAGAPPGQTKLSVTVPEATKTVHVSISRADLSFGESGNPAKGNIGRIAFSVTRKSVSGASPRKCEILVEAYLQSVDRPPVQWSGRVAIEVLCFG